MTGADVMRWQPGTPIVLRELRYEPEKTVHSVTVVHNTLDLIAVYSMPSTSSDMRITTSPSNSFMRRALVMALSSSSFRGADHNHHRPGVAQRRATCASDGPRASRSQPSYGVFSHLASL